MGALIDRHGFRLPGLLLIATMELVIGCLWLRGAGSQWLSLMLICALAALSSGGTAAAGASGAVR